jgi:RHS repeat-associated protein
MAEMDATNNITAYYVYGPGGILSRITPAGNVYYYHHDNLGSTVAITDSAGNIINKYAYDSFGKVLNQVETISNPFKYVGALGVMDDGNGLLYMRARYYDPEVGRFISKDPIGFAGGDLNLYNYVGANPVNWVDPLGLILHYANTNSETAMKPHIKRIMTTAKGRKLLKMLHNDP